MRQSLWVSSLIGPDHRYVKQWDLAHLPFQHLRHYLGAMLFPVYPIVAAPRFDILEWAKEAIVSGRPPRRLDCHTGWSSIRIPNGRGT